MIETAKRLITCASVLALTSSGAVTVHAQSNESSGEQVYSGTATSADRETAQHSALENAKGDAGPANYTLKAPTGIKYQCDQIDQNGKKVWFCTAFVTYSKSYR